MKFNIVKEGIIEISQEEGIKDSSPSSSLIQIGELNILVDTEHPKEDSENLLTAMAELGIKGEDVDVVLFTHLHPDHMGHKNEFPNALFVFHEAEKMAFFFKNDKKLELQGSCLLSFHESDGPVIEYVSAAPDFKELNKKIYVHHVPGHTAGSLVYFFTLGGTIYALAGDTIMTGEYFEQMLPPGSSWKQELITAHMQFIKEHADIIIPGHDGPIENRS